MEKSKKNADMFVCKSCDFKCCKLSNWTAHISTRKHLEIEQNRLEKRPTFICESCDVTCCSLSKWDRHMSTEKHLRNIKRLEKCQTGFACRKCNKSYKSRSSVWYHENRCISPQVNTIDSLLNENIELRSFILDQTKMTSETMSKTIETIMSHNTENMSKTIETIMSQNAETMNRALDCCKQNNTTINNIKNDNKSFNINIFLNEQCKDAINFADFIKNIEISHEDLENTAQLGFVSGISKILMDNLKQLGVNERPIHCTDTKRETMYIKDENKWTKEVDDSKLQKAIQTVSCKSMGKLQEWKKDNPDYLDMDSVFSLRCLDIQKNSIAGSDREVYYPKVIHVLARETTVVREP